METLKIIFAILIFSIIILFHELGHFLFAKRAGIRVNEFCIGLGPTLVGFTKGETKYSIKLLPFGGACMMEGEDGDSKAEDSFQSKSVGARISVVAAGPVFNFIMAFVCALILVACTGYDRPVISGVMDGYPAQEAGMKEGDVIKKLNSFIPFSMEISPLTWYMSVTARHMKLPLHHATIRKMTVISSDSMEAASGQRAVRSRPCNTVYTK